MTPLAAAAEERSTRGEAKGGGRGGTLVQRGATAHGAERVGAERVEGGEGRGQKCEAPQKRYVIMWCPLLFLHIIQF
jgi:hypothetical protein